MFEQRQKKLSMAVRVIDDITGKLVMDANVSLEKSRVEAIRKTDGFYVFCDVKDAAYKLKIKAHLYQKFTHAVELPIASADRYVLNVPGENELILVVQGADPSNNTVTFPAINVFSPIPKGTPVVSTKVSTRLTADLEGESVNHVALESIGMGSSRLGNGDLIRIIKERVVRLRPGPYYRFEKKLQRLVGTVKNVDDQKPLAGAQVRMTQVNGTPIQSEHVGPTPDMAAIVYTIGSGVNKRVLGTQRSVIATTDRRGRYNLYFPVRTDLTINSITVTASKAGFGDAAPQNIDFTDRPDKYLTFSLIRS